MIKMNRRARHLFGALALVALLATAAFAGVANAAPAWKFQEKTLEGSEVILGGAEESGLTVPGLTTTCDNFLYELSVSNSGGTGQGSLTDLPLYDCYTDSNACTVESIAAEGLPWSSHLTNVSTTPYIVIEGVKVGIFYEGEECVLGETLVYVKGSAGGQISNETQSATFNASTLKATGTELKALGTTPIEWFGVFPTEAFQWHREQALSVS
jgi:hypothetical protein